ncbi:MAG TPA: PIN domain-containing protein [Candidatus Dormibacteraeota bacterium]|nr:PIN domain-containing protein [Candidatus Dormibacteraeota bacterium]
MPQNILIDLNVILDLLLDRKGSDASRSVLELNEHDSHLLYISAHIVTTFAYLLEEAKVPISQIQHHINWLIETFTVVSVDNTLLKNALKSRITDYEDAVIEQAAIICGATAIITRNVKDFKTSSLPALKPEEYISGL